MLSLNPFEILITFFTDGVCVFNESGECLYANQAAEGLLGISARQHEELTQQGAGIVFLSGGRKFSLPEALAQAVPGVTLAFEALAAAGARRWLEITARKIDDWQGQPATAYFVRDATRRRTADAALARSAVRQDFLAKAGDTLAASLDFEQSLPKAMAMAVPDLADWVAVDVLGQDGCLKRLASAHFDRDMQALLQKLPDLYPDSSASRSPLVAEVMSHAAARLFDPSALTAAASARDERHFQYLKSLGFSSLVLSPLKILGQNSGVVIFGRGESRQPFSPDDLAVAEELSRRVSLSLQNSRLYRQAKAVAARQHEQAVLLETLLAGAPLGFAMLDPDLNFTLANHGLAEISGLSPQEHAGRPARELLPGFGPAEEELVKEVVATRRPALDLELALPPSGAGEPRHWLASFYPVVTDNGRLLGIGAILREVTSQKRAEREIRYHAFHDPLTGLPNRKYFDSRLRKTLARARLAGRKCALLFLDLDRLKNINDTLGHGVGDTVLDEAAARISAVLGAEDLVARWGGDEFVILLADLESSVQAERAAKKILQSLEPPMRFQNRSLHVTASLGIAMFPDDGADVATLQKNADAALYRAKERGKNRYEPYRQSLNSRVGQNLALENELRQAIERQELDIYYQPIWDLRAKAFCKAETLLRWRHSRLGEIKPSRFVALAEDTGLIVPLGKWAFGAACQHLAWFKERGLALRSSVNISGRQFLEDGFVGDFLGLIAQNGLQPSDFELEVTESVAMENLERTRAKLAEFKSSGMGVVIDDFGTGYSSLSYLKRFPLDGLKIDQSFVRHCITDEHDTGIIKAIISMAKSLHLKVTAEGVDSEMQMGLLSALGCDAVQGYYISRPLSRHELAEFLASPSFRPAAPG